MSGQGYYDQTQGNQDPHSNNPYSNVGASGGQPPSYDPASEQQQQPGGDYTAPPGPPPGQPPKRSETFKESDFVPEDERGEQREAMQQFEMNQGGQHSQQDDDVEQLQREFPNLDGSLVAAIYGDAGNMGATREMLQELASQTQAS